MSNLEHEMMSTVTVTKLREAGEIANDRWTWLGLLAAILLAIPAALPLAGPGLPLTDDGIFHIANIIDLRQALASGEVFPRWLEPLVEGLGFPLFNFYPSLCHYLGAGLTLLGLGEVDAFKLESALLPLLAAAAMYGWANEAMLLSQGTRRTRFFAALGAAITYAYAPYLLVDIYRRGSLAESLALAILPLLFMAIGRLRRDPSLSSALLIAPILAALVLAHNVTAVLGFGLAICFLAYSCLIDLLSTPPAESQLPAVKTTALYFSLGAGLGIGLSALFWAPAILERNYLDFGKLSSGFFSATTHVADAWPPVQLSLAFDFKDPFRAGLAQILILLPGLAPLGAGAMRNFSKSKTNELGLLSAFFALSAAVVIFLLSPLALPVWRDMPLMKEMQYPWRTLGLLAFSGATLTSVGVTWLGSRWPRLLPSFAIALILGSMLATLLTLPTEFPAVPEQSLGAVSDAASLAGWEMRSTQTPRLLSFEDASAITSLDEMRRQPGRIEFGLEASKPTIVALHVLYFPGWKVFVDGREASVFPVTERGLLGIPISGDHHVVEARFERTPLQAAAEGASALAALVLSVLLAASAIRRRPAVAAMLAAAALMCLYATPRLAARPAPEEAFHPVTVPVSDGIRLLGISMEQPRGGRQGITLYWQTLQPLDKLESFAALIDEQGNTVGNPARKLLDGAYPTSRWQVGEIVPDHLELDQLPKSSASGLWLSVGFRPSGQVDKTVPAATFRVPLSGTSNAVAVSSLAKLGTFSDLIDYTPSSKVVSPGDALDISLTWRALDITPGGVGAYLHLVDAQGKMWAQADAPLGPKAYPAVLWGVGERVREERRLIVPADAPPGRYSLRLGAYYYPNLETVPISAGGETIRASDLPLDSIFVVSSETRPKEVKPKQTLKATFGDRIELLGFDLGGGEIRPGQDLELTTYWRSGRSVADDYTLFVQLVDSSGAVRGQSDGQTAGGSYPTSLWRPGEFVVDKRMIKVDSALSGGNYRVIIGFYRWPEMTRLPAAVEGKLAGDAVELAHLQAATP